MSPHAQPSLEADEPAPSAELRRGMGPGCEGGSIPAAMGKRSPKSGRLQRRQENRGMEKHGAGVLRAMAFPLEKIPKNPKIPATPHVVSVPTAHFLVGNPGISLLYFDRNP